VGIHLGDIDRLVILLARVQDHREHAIRVSQRSVEGELPQEQHPVVDHLDLLGSDQERDRDGQVVAGAFFLQLGGREVVNRHVRNGVHVGLTRCGPTSFEILEHRGTIWHKLRR
jgi:hypothetical protein